MKSFVILVALLLPSLTVVSQGDASNGVIVRHVIAGSEINVSRNIDVWLPPDYDTAVGYAVIYMHDGQMLFDSTTTWNRQEWGADEVVSMLIADNRIRPAIIVGIWNRDNYRYTEYYPEKALDGLTGWRRNRLVKKTMMGNPLGDEYLRFIVREVKPFIDSAYSTLSGPANTFVAGSSMGGLISLYAICEYPEVFGGAGCLSTHWPMAGMSIFSKRDNAFARSFRKYISANLPDPKTHRIYFDFGTATLDKRYEPFQAKVDLIMKEAGWSRENWITQKFEGDDHSERSWNRRLHIPLMFLLK